MRRLVENATPVAVTLLGVRLMDAALLIADVPEIRRILRSGG